MKDRNWERAEATSRLDSPVGTLWIATTARGVCAISFDRPPGFDRLSKTESPASGAGKVLREAENALSRYFAGKTDALDSVPVDAAGTEFQEQVWKELRRIPRGKTRSYGEIARAIGRPKAVRAVGAANGSNPVPIVVPCHRVIGANGTLTGYGGGLDRKEWLLAHERA